jgi:LacI family transcriptional regulator
VPQGQTVSFPSWSVSLRHFVRVAQPLVRTAAKGCRKPDAGPSETRQRPRGNETAFTRTDRRTRLFSLTIPRARNYCAGVSKPISGDGSDAWDNASGGARLNRAGRVRPVGLRDVAALARVSPATASRSLNGDRTVRADLRSRVEDAAAQLGYRPNALARNLRRQRTDAIGVIVTAIDNSHFSEMVRHIEDEAYIHGYRVLVCNTNEDAGKQAEYLRVLADERVGGVIISPADPAGAEIGEILDAGIPVVAVDREVTDPRADAVVGDNVASVRDATLALIQLGHRQIACVSGWRTVGPSAERQAGYAEAMETAGLTPVTRETNSQIDGGRMAAIELLSGRARPTAIIAANNLMALGVFEAAREVGLQIPLDLAVVGVDDPFWAAYLEPSLTTIAQPVREMATTAMRLLTERTLGGRSESRRVVLPFQVRWRASTGPGRRDGADRPDVETDRDGEGRARTMPRNPSPATPAASEPA